MKLPLALKYDALPKDADAEQTTAALIRHAVNQTHKDGLPRSETRLWAGLERKFANGDERGGAVAGAVQLHPRCGAGDHVARDVGTARGHADGRD